MWEERKYSGSQSMLENGKSMKKASNAKTLKYELKVLQFRSFQMRYMKISWYDFHI